LRALGEVALRDASSLGSSGTAARDRACEVATACRDPRLRNVRRRVRSPNPHPSGARPPDIPKALVPRHVAITMDGNGRWAKARGLPRTKGHEMGEAALFDVVEGAIEIGVKAISAYAFSTENWTRSPEEVRFLMGFNRDVIRRRRDEMHEMGVRVTWSGRAPRLWKSVIKELQVAEELTRGNDVLTLNMCVNYGGRAELADTARAIAREVAAGRLDPDKVDERVFGRHLYVPDLAEADMLWRTSGENRLSNFMLWQAAYSELVFTDILWPDVDRLALWKAIEIYARRDRRFGKA
jgi:undecaprenyl diphosphate synthase